MIHSKDLLNALQTVKPVISSSVLEILQDVKIEDGKMIATDMHSYIVTSLPYKGKPLCVPFDMLYGAIKGLDEPLELTDTLTVKWSSGQAQIGCHNPDHFPDMPAFEQEFSISPPDDLSKIMFATCEEYPFVVLRDGSFICSDRNIIVRLQGDYSGRALIPPKALKIASDYDMMHIGEKLMWTKDNASFQSVQMKGKFPDVDSFFERKWTKKAKISNLKEVLDRMSAFGSEVTPTVECSFGDRLDLKVQSTHTIEESLPISYKGDPFTIKFNIEYLKEVVSHLDDPIEIYMINSQTGVLFRQKGGKSRFTDLSNLLEIMLVPVF